MNRFHQNNDHIYLNYIGHAVKLVNNYKGAALSGAEFSPGSGKTEGRDYIYPNTTQMDYYASKGFGLLRLPFDIARAYSIPYSQLDTKEMGYINACYS